MIICEGRLSAISSILYFLYLFLTVSLGSLRNTCGLSNVHLTSSLSLDSERKMMGSVFIVGSLYSL